MKPRGEKRHHKSTGKLCLPLRLARILGEEEIGGELLSGLAVDLSGGVGDAIRCNDEIRRKVLEDCKGSIHQ